VSKAIWDYDWIFPLRRAKYDGVEVYIPCNLDMALDAEYGNYWSFPKSFDPHIPYNVKLSPKQMSALSELADLDAEEFVNGLLK
jgi:hypothetical protein